MRNEWDLPRLEAWNKYTAQHPPMHVLLAAYVGFKPPPKPEAETPDGENVLAFLAGLPGMAMK